jgi:hypothetical protein
VLTTLLLARNPEGYWRRIKNIVGEYFFIQRLQRNFINCFAVLQRVAVPGLNGREGKTVYMHHTVSPGRTALSQKWLAKKTT